MTTNRFVWGDEVNREQVGGIDLLMYEPRRRQLAELLLDAERWGDRPHLIQGERRLSFDDVLRATDAVAQHLAGLGVAKGDRVLILAVNSPEWIVTLWATIAIGAIPAPGNGWWSDTEVEHAIALVEPTLVVGDPKRLAKVPAGTPTVLVDDLRALVDDPPPAPRVRVADGLETDPGLIVFTAGTTGLPKGATLAHRSWIGTMHQMLALSGRLPHAIADDDPGFVSMLTGPLFHIGGLHALGLALLGGARLVLLEGRFDPGQVLEVIERERVEVWGAIPTMVLRVLDHPDAATRDLSSLRSMPLGGAPVAPELMERIQRAFPNAGKRVANTYGMTETSGTTIRKGRALPAVDARVDATTGELLVRSPGQMLGYWNDPEATAEVLDAEGWIHSGDLAEVAQDGTIAITGRAKDVVIRGGENIAAPHVEAAILSHPQVADVAVVGLAHPDLGEEVAAAVQVKEGATLTPEDLAAHAAPQIASFSVPSAWWITTERLPMTDAGKADKKRLRVVFPR